MPLWWLGLFIDAKLCTIHLTQCRFYLPVKVLRKRVLARFRDPFLQLLLDHDLL